MCVCVCDSSTHLGDTRVCPSRSPICSDTPRPCTPPGRARTSSLSRIKKIWLNLQTCRDVLFIKENSLFTANLTNL